MVSVDPILQCAACSAKLKLRAATIKIVKQVRCVKCQAMLEIPQVLKEGGLIPETPILARPIDPAAPAGGVAPSAATPGPVSVAAPSPLSSPVSAPAPVRSPAPAIAPAVPVPAPAPAIVPPAAPLTPVPVVVAVPGDDLLTSRMAALEGRLQAQQVQIETLSSQIQVLVRLQKEAASACLAGLAK
jgi:hypothetical protein